MNDEEKFKNSLKDLLDEPYYDYDAGNWEKASNHLDAEEAKRKRRLFVWLFTGLGFGIFFSGYLFLTHPNEKTQLSSVENSFSCTEKKSYSLNTKTISAKHHEKNNQETKIKNLKENVRIIALKPGNNSLISSSNTSFSSLQETKNNETSSVISQSSSGRVAFTRNKTKYNSSPIRKITNQEKTESMNSDFNLLKNKKEANDALTRPEISEASKEIRHLVLKDSTQKEKAAKEGVREELPIVEKDTLKKDPIVSKTDSAIVAAEKPAIPATTSSNYYYMEAGSYFNAGWKSGAKREGASLNPYLGLTYLMRLTDKTGFSIGTYYMTISGLNSTKFIKNKKIVFGEENEVTAITPTRLNYVSVPVKIQYTVDTKQILTIGYSVGYLLDVQSKVEKYTEKLNAQENRISYRTGGYTEGFKTFNSQISIGYRRVLYKKLLLNAEFFYGLTDLRDNTFFGLNLNEKTSGLKISLTYNLIKK